MPATPRPHLRRPVTAATAVVLVLMTAANAVPGSARAAEAPRDTTRPAIAAERAGVQELFAIPAAAAASGAAAAGTGS